MKPADVRGLRLLLGPSTRGRTRLTLQPREAVFDQGDPADAVYCVRTGSIELKVVSDRGKECTIAMFGPGDVFGEECLGGQSLRIGSAVALVPSEVVRTEKTEVLRLLRERPDFAEAFIEFLVARNIQFEQELVGQLVEGSERRLAMLLVQLADPGDSGEPRPILPRMSQEALAARVGTTRSRINFFMNKFRRLGLIEYDGDDLKVHIALLRFIARED